MFCFMKLLLILLFAAASFGQSIPEQVKKFQDAKRYGVEYDKFRKSTDINFSCHVKPTKGGVEVMIWALLNDDGERYYSLYFRPYNHYRSLYNQPTLRLLLDGELVEVEDDEIDYSVMFNIKPDLFNRIAKSKIVEVQVPGFEGVVTDKCMTAFRNIAGLTVPR